MSVCDQSYGEEVKNHFNENHCVHVMKLLNNDRKRKQTFCDGKLKASGREFPVHKCVVGLVSEYFEKLFLTEMREKYAEVVQITGISDLILEKVLDFTYTGSVSMTADTVCDLLEGAEYAQIGGLRINCKEFLFQSMNAANCLRYRALGQRYNLADVCEATDRVIAENFADILQHESFNELDISAMRAVLDSRPKPLHEEVVFSSIVGWVNHNLENRQELFEKLFSLVDLSCMPLPFLWNTVRSEPLVFGSLQCLQRLLEQDGPLSPNKVTDAATTPDTRFVVIGGEGTETSCVKYDNNGRCWNLPVLKFKRCGATAVKIGNHLYVAGGGDMPDGSSCKTSTEMLDLQKCEEWVRASDMTEPRKHFSSAVLQGRMVVTGGNNSSKYLSSCERYNPNCNEWQLMKPMIHGRTYHAMACLNGLLYCIGGVTKGGGNTNTAEYYDSNFAEWQLIAPMPMARSGLTAVVVNGFIYAIGGYLKTYLKTVERYNPETNTWTQRADLNIGRNRPCACVINGKIYIVGGKSGPGPFEKSVEVYDESADTWEVCFQMKASAFNSCVVAL